MERKGAERSGGLHKPKARKTAETLASRDLAEPLSVLSTSVTKQTGDMVYSEARPPRFLTLGNARRCCMPWKESRILNQRLQFLSGYQKEEMSVADLCREYGISRPTGYRWINRYNETAPEGLVDRSRRRIIAPTQRIGLLATTDAVNLRPPAQ
jgi:Helix-turn-helix domain